jgi:hypothetical protein
MKSAFHCWDKILKNIILRGEWFIVTHSFRGFSSWSLSSTDFESVVRQHIMVGNLWWSKAAHLKKRQETNRF